MRARLLVPALFLLCLPLRAGDPSGAENAIALLKSPDLAARNEGTRLMDKEMRRLLAPFLKAMKNEDPEVRRRVAQALLALVPHHDRELASPQQQGPNAARQVRLVPAGVGKALFFPLGMQRKVNFFPFGMQPKVIIVPKAGQVRVVLAAQGKPYFKQLGVTGVWIGPLFQLTGFQLTQVLPDGVAAKAGLKVGDMIVSVNGTATKSIKSITKALTAKKGWAGAKLEVRRGVKTIEITLP